MANTYVDYTAEAAQTDYNFSFEYLRDEHVKVKVNGVETSDFTIVTSPTPTKIRFNTAPVAGAAIKIYRDSRGDFSPLVDFVDGSILTENELDEGYKHNLFLSQEASEGTGGEQLTKKGLTHYDAEGNKIINLFAPSDATDAANKAYVDDTIDTAIALGGSPAIVSLGGYDVTATGSTTARSLADRFADSVNVLDFIPSSEHVAIKNGTSTYDITDDIQAALNASNAVYIPSGTYKLDSTVNLPSNCLLYGNGDTSVIICKTNTSETYFLRADIKENIELRDFKITSDSTDGTRTFVRSVGFNHDTNSKVNGIFFNDCVNISCKNITGEYLNRGMMTESCSDIDFSNNRILYSDNRAMSHNQSNRIRVHGNYLYLAGQSMGMGFPTCSDIDCFDNFIFNPEYTGINTGGADEVNTRSISIVSNTVIGQDAINLEKGVVDVTVSSNTVYVATDAASNGNGIAALNDTNDDFSSQVLISSNRVRAFGDSAKVESSNGATITTSTAHGLTAGDYVYFLDTNLPDIEARLLTVLTTPTTTTFTTGYTPSLSLNGIMVQQDGYVYANGIRVRAAYANSKGDWLKVVGNQVQGSKTAIIVGGNTLRKTEYFDISENQLEGEGGIVLTSTKYGKVVNNYIKCRNTSVTSGDYGIVFLSTNEQIVVDGNITQGFEVHYQMEVTAVCTNVEIRNISPWSNPGGGAYSIYSTNGSSDPFLIEAKHRIDDSTPNLQINNGSVALTGFDYYLIQAESGTSDNLDTINGGSSNQIIMLRSDDTDTITLIDDTGNLKLAGDFIMNSEYDRIVLQKDPSSANWVEISRSDNES